ncbi:hypothetical protein [Herminiimonas arsenitoxidans]|uniref:hypothetical protein n=1 Tax=Herminiimonas arsenitoxidans TaxID=1809410 RepID=UPI000970FE3C|nr:hypothetical protein [Herminiimonas arsenitoxidans]
MNRIFKTFMLWLLVLALPVQGFAATMQMSCAPEMHHSVVTPASDTHAHHGNMDAHVDMDMTSSHTAQSDSKTPFDQPSNMKCSACAACCMGIAALPATLDLPIAASGSAVIFSSPATFFLGHIPDGIKRPPKSILV